MATLTQEPNKWNLAYVPNVYVLDTLGAADRYVLQVLINGVAIATFNQTANPAGVGQFDISKVLQSYMNPTFVETTAEFASTPHASVAYQVRYGSDTNGIITFDGTTSLRFALNGYDNWRVLNWDYTNHIPEPTSWICEGEVPVPNAIYSKGYEFLTNYPLATRKVRSNEYNTLSFFNQIFNWDDGTMWGPNESPFFVSYDFYSSAGALISRQIYTITSLLGLGTRVDCNDNSSSVGTQDDVIGTIGSGVQNLKDALIWHAGAARYTITLWSKDVCALPSIIDDCEDFATLEDYLGYPIYTYSYQVEDPCTPFEPVTVSFVNQYGVKDYYCFDRRNRRLINTERNNYTRANGTFSSSTFSIDENGRGETTFSSGISTQMTLSTYWMEDSESKWLQELFTSPSIQIYVDGQWEPCVLESSQYDEKTFKRDLMFQHEITVKYSNSKKVQRG